MAKQPQLLGYTTLLGDPVPTKWERVKQALWETNLNAPVRGIYNLMNTPYETLMGAPSPEFDQAVADSFDAAGGITVGSMPMPKPSNALTMGIKAYHGSPHSFDKFSMDKIGTGEGAQAYGHGLYFAENEGVAQGYKNALAPGMGDGALRAAGVSDAELRSMRQFTQSAVDPDIALRDWLSWNKKTETPEVRAAFMQEWNAKNPGSMYEVNIDADPNAFLDWDKPLSEQPEAVRNAIEPLMQKVLPSESSVKVDFERGPIPVSERHGGHVRADKYLVSLKHPTQGIVPGYGDSREEAFKNAMANFAPDHGAGFYNALARNFDGSAGQTFGRGSQPTSQALKEAGIPGIKYLDAGSRGVGDGTRNYVVFDDKLISIVRKYGIAGASAMLGYNVMQGANKAQASELEKANAVYHGSNLGGGGW